MLALNKTKAALQGRLSHFTNNTEEHSTVIDQVNACSFAHISFNYGKSPEVTAAMPRFLSEGVRHWSTPQSPKFSGDLQSAENSAGTWLSEKRADQPLGSIPRDCSSFRSTRFIQAASDSSPSCRCASSIKSRSSGSSRNWNGGLPRLSFLCVDTFSTPDVVCLCVMTHYMHAIEKATPRSAGTLPRRLTKPLIGVTVMADIQSTQTHPKFTWRFLALSVTESSIVRITAATEREARDQSPAGCVMVFAGRLPVQGVQHA